MFNRIEIEIVESGIFRYLVYLASVLSLCAVAVSSTALLVKFCLFNSVLLLAFCALKENRGGKLIWYPDKARLQVMSEHDGLVDCEQVLRTHLLMKTISLKFKTRTGENIRFTVFPDSVSSYDYRVLKSLVLLAKYDLKKTNQS